MIRSFRDKDTERLFAREPVKKWGRDVQRSSLRKLRMLDAAIALEDLKSPPGNRLEKLAGDRAGQWSIRINDQWRICFVWRGTDADEVEIVDYH
ncbi:MAG: type II toxin-antitoxin system RelE/ParE family toxin [Candidatus Eiseniibacteriota bacterium]